MAVVHTAEPVTEHHHHDDTRSDNGVGFIVGVVLLLLLAFALFYYGLPALRGATTSPTVNVPGQVDVNVNKGQ